MPETAMPETAMPETTSDPELKLGEVLRSLRRRADLSQRELAARAGVPKSTVSRIESDEAWNPSFRTVERLVRAAGEVLRVGVPASEPVPVPVPHEDLRDAADRHYPAHLDVAEVTRPEKWWGSWWTLTMVESHWPLDTVPPYTYDGSRHRRDRRRERRARGARVQMGRADVPELAGRGWVWLAHDGEARVGELRAHRGHDGDIVLDGVVVAPDWRGCGVGRRLVEELLRHAAGARVTALADEFGAGLFLRACGFQRSGGAATRWVAA